MTDRGSLSRISIRRDLTAVLLAILAAAGTADARQNPPIEPRQPIQELIRTEVVYAQDAGEFQLTVRSAAAFGPNLSVVAFPVQAEFGLTDKWQVELEWGAYSRVRTGDLVSSAHGALSIGTKYSFMNIGGSPVHMAGGVELDFPGALGPDGLEEEGRELEPFIAFAVAFPSRVQAFFHTGRSFDAGGSDSDSSEDELSPMIAAWNAGGLVALRHATLALEFNARTGGSPWASGGQLYATPSITLLLPRAWELGIGAPIGLNSRSDRLGIAVHVIYEK